MDMHVDVMKIIGLVIVLMLVGWGVSQVSPALVQARQGLAEIQYADQHAQARIEGEKANALAQADALKVQTEISKTQALALADVQRKQADTEYLKAQAALEKSKADGQTELAKVSADAVVSQRWADSFVNIFVTIFSAIGLGFVARILLQAYRDRLKAQNARHAIELMATNGGSMALDNGHSFTVQPRPLQISAPQIQAIEDKGTELQSIQEGNDGLLHVEQARHKRT